MATVRLVGGEASPQGSKGLSVVQHFEVDVTAAELTLNAEFDLGFSPEAGKANKSWRFAGVNMSRKDGTGIDAATGARFTVRDDTDENMTHLLAVTGLCLPYATDDFYGQTFPDGRLKLVCTTAPTTPQDGTLIITILGYSL